MVIFRGTCGVIFFLLLCINLFFPIPFFAVQGVQAAQNESAPIALSAAEKAYVDQAAPLRVAVVLNWQPFMYRSKDGVPRGIAFDLLEKVTSASGLRFDFVPVDTFAEAVQLVATGKLDLLGGVVLNEKLETEQLVVLPYIRALNLLIAGKNVKSTDFSQLAVAGLSGSTLVPVKTSQKMLFFPTLERCLEAVRNGRADYTRINMYTAQMLLWQLGATGFNVTVLPDEEVQIGFGVSGVTNGHVASLLEKSLRTITPEERRAMIFQHTLQPGGADVSWLTFMYRYPVELLCAMLPLMVAILIGFFAFFRIRSRHEQKISGYEESYRLLANTLGEVGIEYDYIKDSVTFLGRSRDMLALDGHIEAFREKLKTGELPLSLTLDEFNQVLQNGVAGKSSVAEFQCRLREKGWAWFQLVCTVVCTEESHRRPVRLIGCLVNVDAERREKELLRDLSQIDTLTGLLNRATGNRCIREHLPLCTPARAAVLLLIDVDAFKYFNDTYGHLAGDEVLKALAAAMKEVFRAHDVLCRWGGDEFIIFLKDVGNSIEAVRNRTELLRTKLRAYKDGTGTACPVTLSIGGTLVESNINLDILFQEADDALYEVKKQGRDGFLMHVLGEKFWEWGGGDDVQTRD